MKTREPKKEKMIFQQIGFAFRATWLTPAGANKGKTLLTQIEKIERLFSHDFGEKAKELGIKIELIDGK